MKSRATRNRRLRSCAWAFLAALLPAAESWADGELSVSASPVPVVTEGAPAVAPRPKKSSSSRPKIPPPRKFSIDPAPATDPLQVAIDPAGMKAADVAAPSPSPAPSPAPLSQGDPARVAAAAALLGAGTAPAPAAPTDLGTVTSAVVPPSAPAVQTEPPAAPVGSPAPFPAESALSAPALEAEPAPGPEAEPAPAQAAAEMPPAPAPADMPAPAPAPAPAEMPASAPAPEAEPAPAPAPAPAESAPAMAPAPAPAPATDPTSTQAQAPAPATDPASAQAPASDVGSAPTPEMALAAAAVKSDGNVKKTGCSTCGGFHSTLDGPAFHQSFGCSTGQCLPGRKGACAVPANDCDTIVGNFVSNLWQCLCCPDPCYQPAWVPAANASFFADYARPRTVTRLRFDRLMDMTHPDRNQYFLKMTNPNQASGLQLPNSRHPNFSGKFYTDPSMNMSQLYLYQEAATEKASFFIEIPYRQINPLLSPTQAGFADLNLGSKALLFDCEMLQVTFQFRTFLPTGNAQAGLGTAHVSLDPSLLASLKLTPDTYFQAQVGNWIPLGGTSGIAGGMAYWLFSFNQVLAYITPDSPLIGTFEMDGYSFQNGGYTQSFIPAGSKATNPLSHSGDTYFNIGPGLRQSICNKVDFGGAITWATTGNHWADPWFRLEMRFLF